MKIKKKIKILNFKLSKILNGGLFGNYKSSFTGNGMEFSEHKEYNYGDSVKDIDWKASGKSDQIYIKKYEEERDLNVLFLIDNSLSMQYGYKDKTKKELIEEVFYLLSMSAYFNNDNVGGLIIDENKTTFIDYKKSKNNIYMILDKLDNNDIFENKKNIKEKLIIKNRFKKYFEELINRGIKDNLIFILSDSIDDIDEKLIQLVSEKNDIIYINIFDSFENNLSCVNIDLSLNLGNEFLNIDLNDNEKIKNYVKLRNSKINYFKGILEKNKVGYINIDTDMDVFKILIGYFRKIKK